jgi:hypothetical protein
MNEKRDTYMKTLKAKLDEWNAEIGKLAEKVEQTDIDAKIEYQKQLEDLRARLKDLDDKITPMQQVDEGGWEDLKQGIENSWEILKISISKAKSEFERGYKEGREEE